MSESTFPNGSREDAYLEWRARLAAKQEARRTQPESPSNAAANPMWDPARLFEKPGSPKTDPCASPAAEHRVEHEGGRERIDLRTEAIDLRTPLAADRPSSDGGSDRSALASSDQPRRRVLAATYLQSRSPSSSGSGPAIADGLRELNEQRVNGTISDEEFKVRKAQLFSQPSRPLGPDLH